MIAEKEMPVESVKRLRTALVIIGTLIGYGTILPAKEWQILVMLTVSLGLCVYGSYLWAKLKGRHWAWMLFGLLAPIGFLALALLKSKEPATPATTQRPV